MPSGFRDDNMRLAPPGGPFVPSHCQGITKSERPCSARPVKGELFCIGHKRRAENGSE
jgi:hypothetical protein